MDRKKFIRNIIGTAAAVTIGKHLAPLVPSPVVTYYGRPDAPGIGGQLFKVTIKEGWFMPGDIVLKNTCNPFTSDASQYYVEKRAGKLIGIDIGTGEPKIEFVEDGVIEPVTEKYGNDGGTFTYKPLPSWDPVIDGDYRYDKLASALPELPQPRLTPKFGAIYLNGEPAKYVAGVDPWR